MFKQSSNMPVKLASVSSVGGDRRRGKETLARRAKGAENGATARAAGRHVRRVGSSLCYDNKLMEWSRLEECRLVFWVRGDANKMHGGDASSCALDELDIARFEQRADGAIPTHMLRTGGEDEGLAAARESVWTIPSVAGSMAHSGILR